MQLPKFPTYIINYTPFKQRLSDTILTLSHLHLSDAISVVNTWDREDLNPALQDPSSLRHWQDRLSRLAPILLANADLTPASIGPFLPEWCLPRILSLGEISVLMKHFYAISSIAVSHYDYGLIIEDDVRASSQSVAPFWDSIVECNVHRVDYLDIAGGSGLLASKQRSIKSLSQITILESPRTRTSACYLISRRFARYLANRFFPLVYPIDWHIQSLMVDAPFSCGWCKNPPLIHGSENGLTKSWREIE
jgi:GR25 family glycosyltransferase involved in LPS biosynthesis